jgi:hypothetical protein
MVLLKIQLIQKRQRKKVQRKNPKERNKDVSNSKEISS